MELFVKIFVVPDAELTTKLLGVDFLQYRMRPSNVSIISLTAFFSATVSDVTFLLFWFTREFRGGLAK